MTLKFNAVSQLLECIHLDMESLLGFPLLYQGKVFSSDSVQATFTLIYQTFGPVQPGTWHADGVYHLKYPGITFVFPLLEEPNGGQLLPFTLKDGSVPVLKEIIILSEPAVKEAMLNSFHDNTFIVKKGKGIDFTSKGYSINIFDDCQEVLSLLGAPADILYKKASKLGIHDPYNLSQENEVAPSDYFWNYFSLGIDVLFDGHLHKVKKIILRTNSLSHPLLLRYNTCNFIFVDLNLKSTDVFGTVIDKFGPFLGQPVVYDIEGNPFGPTLFYAFESGLIFEIMKNERICSLTICDTTEAR